MAREYRARDLLGNRMVIIDSLLPPVAFVAINGVVGLRAAVLTSLGVSTLLVAARLVRRQRVVYALGGLGGALLSVAAALLSGSAEGYFVPGIVTSVLGGAACVLSILVKRPLIALSGWFITRWPLDWYWHDQVRPAYSEITWVWAAFYLGKAGLQGVLAHRGEVGWLTVARVLTGWPSFALLVVATYAYVYWRLARLGGPTVDEWRKAHHDLSRVA